MSESNERMSAHADNERSEAAVDVPRLVRRLRLQPEDIGGPSRMEMLRERIEAADALEALLSERIGWRCKVGNEVFTTCEKDIADEWRKDGLDVEKFFAPNADLLDRLNDLKTESKVQEDKWKESGNTWHDGVAFGLKAAIEHIEELLQSNSLPPTIKPKREV